MFSIYLQNYEVTKYKIYQCVCVFILVTSDVAYNLGHHYTNVKPRISWAAHAVGALSGFLLGLILYKSSDVRSKSALFKSLFVTGFTLFILLFFALVLIDVQIHKCTPVNLRRIKYRYFCWIFIGLHVLNQLLIADQTSGLAQIFTCLTELILWKFNSDCKRGFRKFYHFIIHICIWEAIHKSSNLCDIFYSFQLEILGITLYDRQSNTVLWKKVQFSKFLFSIRTILYEKVPMSVRNLLSRSNALRVVES